jgi:hypothetical protein
MKPATLRTLLKDLRSISFNPEEKESRSQILLDFLEIVAVACGKKPAHLQGQGMRSESLTQGIEETATRHGLHSLRTHPMFDFWPRSPNYEIEFFEWQREQDRLAKEQQPSVLWVFKDPELEAVIDQTVSGDIDASAALGYPECCVREHDELGVQLAEMLVEGFKHEHGAKSVEDFIHCTEIDAEVPLDLPHPGLRIGRSAAKFRFVQFSACENCFAVNDSPATQVNLEMRKLARTLSPFFHDKIERSTKKEYTL